mmetsp:Transcript_19385/g.33337  ORF Transcript_19385/g.33337 Transcript_19385/m.33337 type:complete len:81 (-) Transcript_19385:240-482(-)
MWRFFVLSMKQTNSVNASIINTSCQFIFTALFSFVLFGETLNARWWLGLTCLLVGLILILRGTETKQEKTKNAKSSKKIR